MNKSQVKATDQKSDSKINGSKFRSTHQKLDQQKKIRSTDQSLYQQIKSSINRKKIRSTDQKMDQQVKS